MGTKNSGLKQANEAHPSPDHSCQCYFVLSDNTLLLRRCIGNGLISEYIASASGLVKKKILAPEQVSLIKQHISSCKYCNRLFGFFISMLRYALDYEYKERLAKLGFRGVVDEVLEKLQNKELKRAILTLVK